MCTLTVDPLLGRVGKKDIYSLHISSLLKFLVCLGNVRGFFIVQHSLSFHPTIDIVWDDRLMDIQLLKLPFRSQFKKIINKYFKELAYRYYDKCV